MSGPIKPSEVVEKKKESVIPDFVFGAFNFMIAKNFSKGNATVYQNAVIDKIIELSSASVTRQQIFNEKWLDVEEIYMDAGWSVYYDKPGYNESYEAYFKFSKK